MSKIGHNCTKSDSSVQNRTILSKVPRGNFANLGAAHHPINHPTPSTFTNKKENFLILLNTRGYHVTQSVHSLPSFCQGRRNRWFVCKTYFSSLSVVQMDTNDNKKSTLRDKRPKTGCAQLMLPVPSLVFCSFVLYLSELCHKLYTFIVIFKHCNLHSRLSYQKFNPRDLVRKSHSWLLYISLKSPLGNLVFTHSPILILLPLYPCLMAK